MIVFVAPHSDHQTPRVRQSLPPAIEARIEEAAHADEPVLITGRTDWAAWVARLVYLRSGRCEGPFRVLDAADDPISFGDRLGRIAAETARGEAPGMIYLRDLAHAGAAAQRALNSWLAEVPARTAPRLVASSSAPLEDRVKAGLFDPSLFQRIARIEIRLADLPDKAG